MSRHSRICRKSVQFSHSREGGNPGFTMIRSGRGMTIFGERFYEKN